MVRNLVLPAVLLLAPVAGCAVPQSQDVRGTTVDVAEPVTGGRYWLYLPAGYNSARKCPLVVSIHGMKPFDNAMPQLKTWRKLCDDNGWIAVAPQLRSPDLLNQFPFRVFDDMLLNDEELIVAAVRDVIGRYSVDRRHVMLTGWSSGGYLIHEVAARHPELFSLVAPQGANFSGDIMPGYVNSLARNLPIYMYRGRGDLPLVIADTDRAAAWYRARGYQTVILDLAPGGHERHPELAAKCFTAQIRTPGGVLAASANDSDRLRLLAQPWLTERSFAAPVLAAADMSSLAGGRSPRPVPTPAATPSHTVTAGWLRILPSMSNGLAPMTVEFRCDAAGFSLPIVGYRWHMENTLFCAQPKAMLTFVNPGRYVIELTAFDAAGKDYHARTTINVSPPQRTADAGAARLSGN